MKAIFYILGYSLITTLLISSVTSMNQDIINVMKAESGHLASTKPANADTYIRNIVSSGEVKAENFPIAQLETKFIEYKFEERVKEKFRGIIFAKSLLSQSFNLDLSVITSDNTEVIGFARRVNDNVEMAYFRVYTYGISNIMHDRIPFENCTYILFFKKCKTYYMEVPRGYHKIELNVIQNTLKAATYEYIKNKLNEMSTAKFLVFSEDSSMNNSEDDDLPIIYDNSPKINSAVSVSPVDEIINNNKNNKYILQIKDTISNIKQNVDMQKFETIDYTAIDSFIGYITDSIFDKKTNSDFYSDSDITLTLKKLLSTKLNSLVDNLKSTGNMYSIFRMAYTTIDNELHFHEIMLTHNSAEKTFNVDVRSLSSKMEIVNDFYVTKEDDDNEYTFNSSQEDTKVNNKDVSMLMRLFEILVLEKNNNSYLAFLGVDINASFAMLSTTVGQVALAWQAICAVFKTKITEKIKDTVIDRGFSYFDSSAQLQVIANLKPEGFPKFIDLINRRLQVPDGRQGDVKMVLEEIQWMDTQIWSAYDTLFSIGTTGQVKYVTIMANRGKDDKYNIVITEIQTVFALADDIMIINKSISVLGGIWGSSTDRVKYMPKNLTEEDVKATFAFFQLVVFKQVGSHFGFNLSFPQN